ncbi:hypothetical protein WN51_00766 [Melipona quadrifasciata]|uniref:Uncharacterized protein n=1 Tax=Melipona quadrifasciata TaxID=166423 RepID=A0A0M8ZYR8_9HYME|nr:hypothetical protein WN51_00766 [Melipona quadrifasciata]
MQVFDLKLKKFLLDLFSRTVCWIWCGSCWNRGWLRMMMFDQEIYSHVPGSINLAVGSTSTIGSSPSSYNHANKGNMQGHFHAV